MKNCTSFLIFLLILSVSSCCTKKLCKGLPYKDIIIVFRGFNHDIYPVSISEYDLKSTQLINTTSATYFLSSNSNDSIITIGNKYVSLSNDSFYLDQRFFVVNIDSQTYTLRNISYQKTSHTLNCNHCPGDNEVITEVSNFNFTFNNRNYKDGDTLFIYK